MSFEENEAHDLFENAFFYYIKALRVLSYDAETQCEEMGNYNTPWELQADVGTSGTYLIRPAASYLTWEQTEKIVELSAALRVLRKCSCALPNLSKICILEQTRQVGTLMSLI